MKDGKEVTEILEAYDLTDTYAAAVELVGCDPKTVKHHVACRDAGLPPGRAGFDRVKLTDAFEALIEQWVRKSIAAS